MEENKTRIQVDLSPTELERMNIVMQMTGLVTRKELFNNALSLFEWAAVRAAEGKEIGSIDSDNKVSTILMPALSNATVYGRRPESETVRRAVDRSLHEDEGVQLEGS